MPAKISTKAYQCPLCGNSYNTSTNHFGEIYTHCRKCGNGVLYCMEPEAVKKRELCFDKTLQLVYYNFNVENADEKARYAKLTEQLADRGRKCFNVVGPGFKFMDEMSKVTEVRVVSDSFPRESQQFVSDVGRVHDWYEAVYPNRKIKKGYFLIDPEGELL